MRFVPKTTPGSPAARIAALALTGALTLGAGAATASADPGPPPSDSTPDTPDSTVAPVVAATSSITLPLLGTGLVVDVATDPGGNLVDVALNQPTDFIATTLKPNKVSFVNEAGGVRIKVKAKRGGERVEARAAELGDVSGPGQWSGDVFDDGQSTTVDFTIGDRGDGTPDITGLSVSSPFTNEAGDVEYGGADRHGGVRASAAVAIRFSNAGQTRTLRIKVSTFAGGEHTSAKLSIGLSRIKGAEIPDGPAVGAHTWTGMLCDGTTATVDYTVTDDGSITDVVTTPDGATVESGRRGTTVRFATGEKITIRVRDRAGELEVGVKERIRCEPPEPAVNTEVDPDADRGDHDGWGDGRRDRRDRDHHRHDLGDGGADREHRDGDRDHDRDDGDRDGGGRRGGD
jgi:hypothetical protein